MTVYYLPLEAYEERYTLQLATWTKTRFQERGISFVEVLGDPLMADGKIHTGIVLDAHGRSYYALTQMANLVKLMRDGQVTSNDIIYTQDFFHPGFEALPYIIQQSPEHLRPRVYTHLLAQTIDPNDFTFPMRGWMRPWEIMADKVLTGIFLASSCMVDMLRAAMFEAPLHVVGLPFDAYEVNGRVGKVKPWDERTKMIVFTSRFDREKQPWFYMDLVERCREDSRFEDYTFAICTGSPKLRSNEPAFVERARQMEAESKLSIFEGLKKSDYYGILANARVQFNCALQDFVSNTLNEASALGTPTLAPAYLSFPEALFNESRQLYAPWSLDDAHEKLARLIENPPLDVVHKPAAYHHATMDRVIDVMAGIYD